MECHVVRTYMTRYDTFQEKYLLLCRDMSANKDAIYAMQTEALRVQGVNMNIKAMSWEWRERYFALKADPSTNSVILSYE